jgi:CHRD domain
MSNVRKIQKMPLWTWALAVCVAWAVAACGGGGGDAAAPPEPTPTPVTTVFQVSLSGDQEVPATTTGGLASGSLTFASPTLAISGGITVNGITATAAHIHTGVAGTNGGVIVPLTESPAGSGNWIVPAGSLLTQAQAQALLAGGLYFNVHTPANPSGDVRGQIGRDVFAVQMSPAQEVPGNTTTASAKGLLVLDPVSKRFTSSITVTGMTATAAHIHTGVVGSNGPVIFPFTETAAGSGVLVAAADASMTDAQISTLKAGGMYFNAHSAAFPGGQVRGQIARNVGVASLAGAQEVPPTSSTASGTGTLVLDPLTRAASGGITITGMTATAAHIHLAAVGANGPVNVPLTDAGGGVFSVPAGTVLSAVQLGAFKQGNLYFNAHSVAFPGGEIRGQIR